MICYLQSLTIYEKCYALENTHVQDLYLKDPRNSQVLPPRTTAKSQGPHLSTLTVTIRDAFPLLRMDFSSYLLWLLNI